jgi:HSP20 family molecular chaperone IbpA
MLRNDEGKSMEKSGRGPEQTYHGPVYSPVVDIFESDDRISLLADMPGVKPQDLKIDLRESTLTLSGRVDCGSGKNETSIMTEYESGTYFRQFALSEMIDQSKIDAKLVDGVLHLDLPKLERAKPRQISVRTS